VEIRGKGKDIQPIKPKAKWLFLNYVAADNNLTEYQMKNLDQQELVGSDKNTHIVAYIDVGPKPNPFDKQWQNCRAYYIIKDKTPNQLKSELVGEYGRVDSSSPETLKKFLVEAIKKFPADHVALILNDHGGGFTGAMSDDSDGDFMSIPQIKQALAQAEKETGKKIDILGFDACLMAETEVAYELKDNARIMLASEESEGGPGWTYDSMLGGKTIARAIKKTQNLLTKKITVSPEDFARIVVEVNKEHNDDIPTFSATHLTKMDLLAKATDNLAEAIIKTEEKQAVRDAIKKAENYGGGWTPYRDIHDLHHLARNIYDTCKDPALKKSAKEVIKAVEEVIFANEVNPSQHPESKGISIYAPDTQNIGYNYEDLAFAKKTHWDEAIKSLSTQQGKPHKTPAVWPDGSPRKAKKSKKS